jgi:hypothetical protein
LNWNFCQHGKQAVAVFHDCAPLRGMQSVALMEADSMQVLERIAVAGEGDKSLLCWQGPG